MIEVYQEQVLCCTRNRSIKPPQIFLVDHILIHKTLVHHHIRPLTTLRFMTDDGEPFDVWLLNESAPVVGDKDGDGLPNAWELEYFGHPTNAVPSGNGDGDGMDNLSEFIAGTDPTNAASFFAASAGLDPSGFVVSWNSVSGRTYSVLHNGAVTGSFTNLAGGMDYPVNSYTDATLHAEADAFYKLEVELIPTGP